MCVTTVYNPYSIVQLSEVLQDLTLRRREAVIYRGKRYRQLPPGDVKRLKIDLPNKQRFTIE